VDIVTRLLLRYDYYYDDYYDYYYYYYCRHCYQREIDALPVGRRTVTITL